MSWAKTYKNIIDVFQTIEEYVTEENDEIDICILLEEFYPGITYSFVTFKKTKEVRIMRGETLEVIERDDAIGWIDVSKEREDAVRSVKYMCVNVTGATIGSIIIGTHNITHSSLLKISSGILPPSAVDLENVFMFPDLFSLYLKKLSHLDFFSKMTSVEKWRWLRHNKRDGGFDIAEIDNLYISILDVGKSKLAEVETLDELLSGNEDREDRAWLALDVRDRFPRKPGSKAARNTLYFLIHLWKINTSSKSVDNYNGVGFNGECIANIKGHVDHVFDGLSSKDGEGKYKFAITSLDVSEVNIDYMKELREYMLLNKLSDVDKVIDIIKYATKDFTAATFKSLLQKTIRYSPLYVDYNIVDPNPILVDATSSLLITFTLLLLNPGSFVPDIQRFVTGKESAFKRLVVSILEDSSIKDDKQLVRLLVFAFLSQRLPGFKPSKKYFLDTLDICVEALKADVGYEWNLKVGSTLSKNVLTSGGTPLENVSALLDEIRSFSSDIDMVRYIAQVSKGKLIPKKENYNRPKVMHLSHCIDQHSAPEIAYTFPIKLCRNYNDDNNKPFARLFKVMFSNISGINARKTRKASADKTFVDIVEKAQLDILIGKTILTTKEECIEYIDVESKKTAYSLDITIPIGWIAGLAGPIDISGKPPVLVTLKPDDPSQLVAIKKPARGMKDGLLADERVEAATLSARNILAVMGIPLRSSDAPLPFLNDVVLYMKEESLSFKYKGELKTWEELTSFTLKIECYPLLQIFSFQNFYRAQRKDVMTCGVFKTLKTIFEGCDIKVLRRLQTYISINRNNIEIARLSKDGGPIKQSVLTEDGGALQLLSQICYYCPAAIWRDGNTITKFKVYNLPLLDKIKTILVNVIKGKVVHPSKVVPKEGWNIGNDTSNRQVRSYQLDALGEMLEKTKNSKKGHFLWMPVGVGKTLVVLKYIKELNKSGILPKYVLYSLPRSALKSIITEISYFGECIINLLLPIKGWKKHPSKDYCKDNKTLLPYHINIIEHDHLRLLANDLTNFACDTLFIIDEVHKALNDTKRTSVALEISRLAIDFVALTGTPVVDSNTYKLIWWLEQIVDFEVNEKNFWVAANGMIAKKVNTGVLVEKEDVLAPMSEKEKEKFFSLVPLPLGGTNSHPSNRDIMKSFDICYEACERKMISLTIECLKNNSRVMLVGRNIKRCDVLNELLLKEGIKDVHILKGNDSLFMTEESVKSGKAPNVRVVIVPQSKSEGYTLTYMNIMIKGVYPSNNATREQLEGRINRLSQRSRTIYYKTVHCGILSYVLQKHHDASSISAVLSRLAKEIDFED